MTIRKAISLGLVAFASIAQIPVANAAVELSRAVYVERPASIDGERTLEPADEFRPGDRVILYVEWSANDTARPVIISSEIPEDLIFQRSSLRAQSVSVDGGRNWGWIGSLRIRDPQGERLASVEDVTHLRWHIPARHAAQGNGRITYSAIVR